jgi:hypothetical protein
VRIEDDMLVTETGTKWMTGAWRAAFRMSRHLSRALVVRTAVADCNQEFLFRGGRCPPLVCEGEKHEITVSSNFACPRGDRDLFCRRRRAKSR